MGVRAVATTGIYCRPGCAARPLPENVSEYPSAVAAEAAGYRSCLRCRPDRLHQPDPSNGAPAAIEAALLMISDGYLDRHDEVALASRVGYSPRQLRRLFERHVGASPVFVARSRRAHFARRLLDESDLPMATIASASGFGSVRQMNRVIHEIFGFGPQELRSKRRGSDALVADGGLRLRLPFVEPLDRQAALAHLGPRATPGVESVEHGTYRRTLEVCGNPGVIEVDLSGHDAHLTLVAHLPTFDSIIDDVHRVRRMFGLDDEIDSAVAQLGSDPLIGELVRSRPGIRVIGGWDRFETAVRVVVGQQVSVAAATTTTARLVHGQGAPLGAAEVTGADEPDPEVLGLRRLFPTADRLSGLDPAALGMPRSRGSALVNLAEAVLDGRVDLLGMDPAEVRSQLGSVRGVGPWSTELICLRALRDPDAFPPSDLGLRRAIGLLTGGGRPVATEEAASLAERWRPYRALAAQHLWTSLTTKESQ